MHKTMFKKSGDVVAQCVIKGDDQKLFESMGFVDHVDKLKEEKPKRQPRSKKADD